jgi:preprotein translocase subunit SecF
MEFFKIRRDIPFMRNALIFNLVSFVTFVAAVFSCFRAGCICRWSSPAAP